LAPPNRPSSRAATSPQAAALEPSGRIGFARAFALAAVLAAIALVAIVLFTGGGGYRVKAVFQNAGQLVKGNQVEVGGRPIGTIDDIKLTGDGLAEVVMTVDEFTPLHDGTTATIRSNSLSGIANRYVSLALGPNSAPEIPSGGLIRVDRTTAPVDIDQLFDTLDPQTRRGLQQFIQGSATQLRGKAKQANQSLYYLNPALTTSSQVARELVQDKVVFESFLTDTARAVTDLASRRADLAQLVGNANATTAAIGDENVALARALGLLPGTLRKANTTFVNLRSTLNDLDVLVGASKPATRHLALFFRDLQPLVRDARPTIRDLSQLIRRPGPGNDLIELAAKSPRLASLTHVVFPHAITSLQKTQPVLEYARPYAPDLTGWFTKFAESANPYDANGHYARIQPIFNAFSFTSNPTGDVLTATPPAQRLGGFETRQNQRCPGGAMQPPPDGSAPYLETPGFACDPSTTPPGP
jgi:phospholipid/cholesterol/gamma-HCH transport system substrate-binding protein